MKIMPNRMDRGFYQYQKEFEDKALEVLRSGWYVLGKEVSSFEEEFAASGLHLRRPHRKGHHAEESGGGEIHRIHSAGGCGSEELRRGAEKRSDRLQMDWRPDRAAGGSR